jgi:hypothetical protein
MSTRPAISMALKEWDLTISALLSGRQVLLLRKGGILEAENQFSLEHSRFVFYPTFIHQDPRMVKSEFRAGLRQVAAEPEVVRIACYGEAAKIWEVPSRGQFDLLDDLHIWDVPLVDMRFAYRPEKPLYLVAVRAYRLAAAVTLPNTLAYAGCKSWVPLNEEIDISMIEPAMPDDAFDRIVSRIDSTFQPA